MLIYLYNLFWNWRTREKVFPKEYVGDGTFVSNVNFILSKDYSDEEYYELCKKIRNFQPLLHLCTFKTPTF
jgi:hypothetical protein